MKLFSRLLVIMALWVPTNALVVTNAQAEPQKVSSPDLKRIVVKNNRQPGRLIIYANYTTHRILLDDAEVPSYLSDIGIEISSNQLHSVKVINDNNERIYKVSVNPGETLALYVDLGSKKAAKKDDDSKNKKEDKAAKGFISVTAETDAQIFIDGKLIAAKSPLKKHEIEMGSHTVRVYFLDTKTFSKSREVYVGRDASMSVHFAKE